MGLIFGSHDSTPSVLQFPLSLIQNETSDAPNVKRTKLESEENKTIASKLSNNEYTNVNQIEVLSLLYYGDIRMIYLLLRKQY